MYDGNLYKEQEKDGGILSNCHNLSLMFNTDGIPVFKSSKVSVWPIYFTINELPFQQRTLKENALFGGLWFGERKPLMLQFLKPVFENLKSLEDTGVDVEIDGKFINCKVVLLSATCDLPAKSMLVNSMQYNGAFGCWKCLQEGKTCKVGEKGHVRVFPYKDCKGPPRTKENAVRDAMLAASATSRKKHVRGVKGPCWFSLLKHFDHVRGVGIDYMHGVLLGVQKLMLQSW